MTPTPEQIADGPTCIECGATARLVSGKRIYPHRRDLYAKSFYLCVCGAYCGCHPNTTRPLGYPCGPQTRRARSAAHAAFDPLWKRKAMPRSEAYSALSHALGISRDDCHIGMMDAETVLLVPEAVRKIKLDCTREIATILDEARKGQNHDPDA